jgi:hypothetical protein
MFTNVVVVVVEAHLLFILLNCCANFGFKKLARF